MKATIRRMPLSFRIRRWVNQRLTKLGLLDHKSNFLSWCKDEIQRAGLFDVDSDYNGEIGRALMRMARIFSREGHSGASQYGINGNAYSVAGMFRYYFNRLTQWKTLTPLTGEDDEWNEVADGVWQNRRVSTVFKDADGKAYDIDGKVFREPSGATYTSRESRVYITFPYMPPDRPEIIDVDDDGNPI